VDTSIEDAFEQWFQIVWVKGGGSPVTVLIESDGDNETHSGCCRLISGRIREKILEVDKPHTIVYSVIDGPIPLSYHKGTVTFKSSSTAGKTHIRWVVNFVPSLAGRLFGFGGYGVQYLIQYTLSGFLDHLANVIQQKAAQ